MSAANLLQKVVEKLLFVDGLHFHSNCSTPPSINISVGQLQKQEIIYMKVGVNLDLLKMYGKLLILDYFLILIDCILKFL